MNNKLAKNTVSSFIFQITTVICGFILPPVILSHYGSEVNGLINSITQFLSVIAFLELGVGAVVQSSLYKPLAIKDNAEISRIVKSANKFFRTLAIILLFYVIILIILFPGLDNHAFSFSYTATLILSISISSFAQYYFGIVNRLLLLADQKGYVQYNLQTVTLVINTISCIVLISLGASIQLVKLTTSLIYLVRPILLQVYVDRNYSITKNITYSEEPIKQKWNGVAQHIAAVILDGTDTIVLTIFATLSDVSIYSVYYMVVLGVKQLFVSMTSGIQAAIGELWAKQETEKLQEFFSWVEWSIHTGTVFVFSCMAVLIVPFITIYTHNVTDAQYVQPLFAFLLVTANGLHCLRMPYNLMILAGGHYRQTQSNYILAATMNVIVSIFFVERAGLIGVAIGTLAAMLYQTVWMAYYDSSNFIKWPFKNFLRQLSVDAISVCLIWSITSILNLSAQNYVELFGKAILVALISTAIIVLINFIFYREKEIALFKKIARSSKNANTVRKEVLKWNSYCQSVLGCGSLFLHCFMDTW